MCTGSRMQVHAKSKMRKKWWLFHATDFQSLMLPSFFFCYIIGIFPYKLNVSTFVASKPYYVISTVIICFCCIFDLLLIHDIFSQYNFKDLARVIQDINYYTSTGIIAISTHILSGPRMRLLQTILEISSKLSSDSYQKLSRLIHVKDIFGTIFLVVQLCIFFSKNMTSDMTVPIIMFTTYIAWLTFQMKMLYINCVCVLKACFKNINDDLMRIKKHIKSDTKSCILKFISHVQRNQFLIIELKILQKRHLMISDAVQMLNAIFSPLLLAGTVTTFFEITFELYFCVVRWQNGVFLNLDTHFLDVLLFSTGFNIFKMMLLVWVCETGKNQAREIGTTIHDLFNSTNDEQIKNECILLFLHLTVSQSLQLHQFSLQILHRKNKFSAKGFTVDAMFLTAIVSNISLYLVILIQFLNMSHSCD